MYYPTNENVRASLSLRRDPRLGEHILPIILHRAVIICAHLLPPVKAVPHLVPVPPCRSLAVFRCAGFEEIGVLNTVQQRREPRQRVFVDHVDRLETKLAQTPVSDVADVFLDLFRGHAGDWAMFEGEIDERIFQAHRLVTAIENIIADRPGQAVPFLHKCMEKPRDALTMQDLVAPGPALVLPARKNTRTNTSYQCAPR